TGRSRAYAAPLAAAGPHQPCLQPSSDLFPSRSACATLGRDSTHMRRARPARFSGWMTGAEVDGRPQNGSLPAGLRTPLITRRSLGCADLIGFFLSLGVPAGAALGMLSIWHGCWGLPCC